MRLLPLLALSVLLSACGSTERARGGFSADLGVDTTRMTHSPAGLWYSDVTVGQGKEATACGYCISTASAASAAT